MTDYNNQIEQFIGQQKGQRYDFFAILPTSKKLAEVISSFANTNGGFIVLGISESLEIIGLSADFHADSITSKALGLLTPNPTVFQKYIGIKNKTLYVIEVEKAEKPILLEGKTYIRVGAANEISSLTNFNFDDVGYIGDERSASSNKKIDYHAYDVNLRSGFSEVERLMKDLEMSKTGITKEEYLGRLKDGINSYCEFHHMDNLSSNSPIILRYPAYNFHAHLAFQIMTFDIIKIPFLLDYQHENYLGLDDFQKIVEHGVYDWIKRNSPFDNEARLEKIVDWVEKRKGVIHPKNKVAKEIGDKILQEFKKIRADTGHILMMQKVQELQSKLLPPHNKEFKNVFNGMIADGFISYNSGEPYFIKLGDKGYRKIYQEQEITPEILNQQGEELPVVVILTAIKEEYAAVRSHLDEIRVAKKDAYYEEGIFNFEGRKIARVVIKECGAKNPGAAQETQRAISNFQPNCIFFVGIAGSRKPDDFGLGDVIFPSNVHYYEGGKSELGSDKPRPDDVKPSHSLCEIARIERHKNDWKTLIKGEYDSKVKADIGVIASGEQVVEHFDSAVGQFISKHYGDTACIAMEEYGFLNTVHRQGVELTMLAGVVRGVSDILEKKKSKSDDPSEEERRPVNAKMLASNTAAAFAYWLIVKVCEEK